MRSCYDLNGVSIAVETDCEPLSARFAGMLGPFACAQPFAEKSGSRCYQIGLCETVSADGVAPPPHFVHTGEHKLADGSPLVTYTHGNRRTQLLPGLVRIDVADDSRGVTGRIVSDCPPGAVGHAVLLSVFFALEHGGQTVLHSASLQLPASISPGAIVLLGESGAGKSTLAMKLVEFGMPLLSDDISVLRLDDEDIRVWAFPRLVKIHKNTVSMLPWLSEYLTDLPCDADEYWAKLPPEKHFPSTCVAPVARIIFLEHRNPRGHRAAPVDRLDAISRLTQSHVQAKIRERGKRKFEFLADLVRRVPAYRISLGPTLEGIGDLIQEICLRDAT